MTKNLYSIKFRIWITGKEGTFLGQGRVDLLKKIRDLGSITEAAKSMKMSYRQAWKLIQSMNAQSQTPLVLTETGGSGGGGSKISSSGLEAIKAFDQLQEKINLLLEKEKALFS